MRLWMSSSSSASGLSSASALAWRRAEFQCLHALACQRCTRWGSLLGYARRSFRVGPARPARYFLGRAPAAPWPPPAARRARPRRRRRRAPRRPAPRGRPRSGTGRRTGRSATAPAACCSARRRPGTCTPGRGSWRPLPPSGTNSMRLLGIHQTSDSFTSLPASLLIPERPAAACGLHHPCTSAGCGC